MHFARCETKTIFFGAWGINCECCFVKAQQMKCPKNENDETNEMRDDAKCDDLLISNMFIEINSTEKYSRSIARIIFVECSIELSESNFPQRKAKNVSQKAKKDWKWGNRYAGTRYISVRLNRRILYYFNVSDENIPDLVQSCASWSGIALGMISPRRALWNRRRSCRSHWCVSRNDSTRRVPPGEWA